jgi:hypothetical protein
VQLYTAKKDRVYDLKPLDFDEQEFTSVRETQAMDEDYELFLQELDGDKEMRAHVNLYVNKTKKTATTAAPLQSKGSKRRGGEEEKKGDEDMEREADDNEEDREEDDEEVRLEELLDALDLAVNDPSEATVLSAEEVILSVEQAAQVPSIPLEATEFDVAHYDPKDYKFI